MTFELGDKVIPILGDSYCYGTFLDYLAKDWYNDHTVGTITEIDKKGDLLVMWINGEGLTCIWWANPKGVKPFDIALDKKNAIERKIARMEQRYKERKGVVS